MKPLSTRWILFLFLVRAALGQQPATRITLEQAIQFALRHNHALEAARLGEETAVRQAIIAAQDEIAQLRSTVASLREALEQTNFSKQGANAAARAQDHAELAQLQATVRALRDQLQTMPAKRAK